MKELQIILLGLNIEFLEQVTFGIGSILILKGQKKTRPLFWKLILKYTKGYGLLLKDMLKR